MAYLEQAQDAIARHSWKEAFEILTEADVKEGLGPEALEILGDAFWWWPASTTASTPENARMRATSRLPTNRKQG